MTVKSIVRVKIEKAMCKSGIKIKPYVFNDKRKDSRRVKFSFVHLDKSQEKTLRKKLRKQFPNQDIRINDVNPQSLGTYHGTAITIYNK